MKFTKLQRLIKALQTRLDKMLDGVIKCTARMIANLARKLDKLEERLQEVMLSPQPKLAVAGRQYQMTIFDVLTNNQETKQRLSVNKNISITNCTNANGINGFNVVFTTPFNQSFIDEFKNTIPSSQRGWDSFNKSWWAFCFSKQEVKSVIDLMNKHFQLTK